MVYYVTFENYLVLYVLKIIVCTTLASDYIFLG